MVAHEPCRLLEWDSRFFGLRIGSVVLPTLDRAGMDRVLAWCRAGRIDCLYLLSDAVDVATHRLAEDEGFRVVDVRVTLEREVGGTATERESACVRPASPADVPALRAIAAASHRQTRFYSDGRFDYARCDELYSTWIERSCDGWADAVWVAELDGRLAGYLTCHRRGQGRGEIGLVAIGPDGRGRGLGHDLVERGLVWFRSQDLSRISVVTQGANVAAQRLYQSAGFRTASVQLWHHLWPDRIGKER